MIDPALGFALEEGGGNAHLYSPGREHDTDGFDCWCHPTFYVICDECEDGCWRCDQGKNERSRDAAEFEESPMLVVHNP